MLFGKQRLVSPLDWTNTRRTFQGGSAILRVHTWDVTAFWTRPVPIRRYAFNTAERDAQFLGLYASWRRKPSRMELDLYWLKLDRTVTAERFATIGARAARIRDATAKGIDYDVEIAYQLGNVGVNDINAFMLASEVGYTIAALKTPRVHAGFDYASGDGDPNDGTIGTFNQLFPLAHAYLGFIDLVGRQNIAAASGGVSVTPASRLAVVASGHHFWRARSTDALYNAGGSIVRLGQSGTARSVGSEIDATIRITLNQRANVTFGYSHFFPGEFIPLTGPSSHVNFAYAIWQITM